MTTIIGTGEVGALHSREELEEMQRLPLQRKIQITTARIIEWYQHYDGKVYVAFSGGKDSTVLLDIVRRIYPDVPAVFSDTGLEFPEVREFVKSCENVTIVRPEMNFRGVPHGYVWDAMLFPVRSPAPNPCLFGLRKMCWNTSILTKSPMLQFMARSSELIGGGGRRQAKSVLAVSFVPLALTLKKLQTVSSV